MDRKPRLTLNSKSLKYGNFIIGLDKTFRIDNENVTFDNEVTSGNNNNTKFINVRSKGEWVAYCEGGGGIVGGGSSGAWCSIRETKDSLSTDTVIGNDSGGFWVIVTFNGTTSTRTKTITITETETNNILELSVIQTDLSGDSGGGIVKS